MGGRAVALLVVTVLAIAACSGPSSHVGQGGPHAGPTGVAAGPGAAVVVPNPTAPVGRLDVRAENALPGSAGWQAGVDSGTDHGIEGYADEVEVTSGQSFRLFVNTVAPSFTATAFRVGSYHGAGARQIWKSEVLPGQVQAHPDFQAQVNTVSTRWQPSATVDTTGWPEGSYLVRLDPVGASGGSVKGARYVPITVRSPSTDGRVVLINAVTTWQAYNSYGGYDLYQGANGQYGTRSRIVSFDRPYDSTGADRFQNYEQSAIQFAEKTAADKGFQLAYATDVDLDSDPGLFKGARAIITLGHDEYWSTRMRDTATQARDSGTNIAFLGANAVFRHIRFGDSPLGKNRMEIDYKDAEEDPIHMTDPAEATSDWRDAPDPRPENVLTGVFYECNPANADYVVFDPSSWLLEGTGVHKGQRIKGLVGVEYDRVVSGPTTPRPIETLSHSPISCRDHRNTFSDSAYYTVPSGAGVFAVGTMRWDCALGVGGCSSFLDAESYAFAQRVTENLLVVFAAGPAGVGHPAKDNLGVLRPAAGGGGFAP